MEPLGVNEIKEIIKAIRKNIRIIGITEDAARPIIYNLGNYSLTKGRRFGGGYDYVWGQPKDYQSLTPEQFLELEQCIKEKWQHKELDI